MKSWELQKAIFTTLDTGLTVPVYDDVPQGASFPYVSIGEDTSIQWDTDLDDGTESTLTIHVWSRSPGRKEAKELLDSIHGLLHRKTLTVTGASPVFCYYEFAETLLDPDGETRHGVTRYRAVIDLV